VTDLRAAPSRAQPAKLAAASVLLVVVVGLVGFVLPKSV